MTGTLLSAAAGVLSASRDAASHAAWWVSYQVGGVTHEDDRPMVSAERSEKSA